MDDATFIYNNSHYHCSKRQTVHSHDMQKSLKFTSISIEQQLFSLSPAHEKYKQKFSGDIHTLDQFGLIPIVAGFGNAVFTPPARLF